MKPLVLLALLSLIPFCPTVAEEPAPKAPEKLPEERTFLSTDTEFKKTPDNALQPSDFTPAPDSSRSSNRVPTSEELDKIRKDRNWMVEGMKEKQAADAKASADTTTLQGPGNTDMSQSIIDMVLNKNKSPKTEPKKAPRHMELSPAGVDTPPATNAGTKNPNAFQPVISTNSFDNPMNPGSPGEAAGAPSILQQERAKARRAGFKESPGSPLMADPLANPFANLPIPEDALPQSQPKSPATTANMAPAGPLMVTNATSSNMPSAAGPGNPVNSGMAPAVSANNTGAPTPAMAVEQPYAILREQELVRQLQQNNSQRPRVQDLRSLVSDPNDARLF